MTSRTFMLFSHICNAEHMTGAEKYLLFMLQQLPHHHRLVLVVPNDGMLAREARMLGHCDVQIHPFPLLWQMWDPGPNLAEEEQRMLLSPDMRMMLNMLHMHRPDAVFVNTCVNTLPAMAATRLGIPVLWMITEVMREGMFTLQSVSIIHRYATWIGGISDSTLSIFRRAGLESKTLMLNPSWRPDSLHPGTWEINREQMRDASGVGKEHTLVGYIVSDIAPHKGFDHFVEMALRLCGGHPDVHFMIVGRATDQAYYDSTMNYLHQFGYASRFKLLPYHSSIEAVYPAMDLIIVPSLVNEGFGLTAMEGMIFGKPVVAYRSGGLEEILTRTEMGSLLVTQGDIAQLTAVVSGLLRDRNRRLALGRSAQSAVTRVFGIDAYRSSLQHMLQIIEAAADEVEKYRAASRAHIQEGSLLTGAETPAVFLIQNGHKRAFASETAFLTHGFGWQQIITVDDALLQWLPNGPPIIG